MTIALEVLARIRGTLTSAPDAGVAAIPILETAGVDLTDGTGANQGNAVYVDAFSIGSAATLNIDLAGTLTDPLNQTKVFTAIKAILIEADAANTTNLSVGNGTNPFIGPFGADGTAVVPLKPGGVFLYLDPSAAGMAVAAGTGDILKIVNASGAAATGRITLVGEA